MGRRSRLSAVLAVATALASVLVAAPAYAVGVATLAGPLFFHHQVCVEADEVGSALECDAPEDTLTVGTYSETVSHSATGTGSEANASNQLTHTVATGGDDPVYGAPLQQIDIDDTMSGAANMSPEPDDWGAHAASYFFSVTEFNIADAAVPYAITAGLSPDSDGCTHMEVELRHEGALIIARSEDVGCGSPDPEMGQLTGDLQPGDYRLEVRGSVEEDAVPHARNRVLDGSVDVSLMLNGGVQPSLSVGNRSADEGNTGSTPFSFAVSLTPAATEVVTVHFDTVDVTASAGPDYAAGSVGLTFDPGQTTKTVVVQVVGDRKREPTETFSVILSDAVGAEVADTNGTGTIRNDDICDNNYTAARDVINGTAASEVLCGGDGNDVIRGAGGNDRILGGAGEDEIDGGGGDDTLLGQGGTDALGGDDGDDTIEGGGGDDVITGNAGADKIFGGPGNELAVGGTGRDIMRGEGGVDDLFGADGSDTIDGGDQRDELHGGDGTDLIHGRAGDDAIEGGAANDVLFGDDGHDELDGDGGEDTIIGGPDWDAAGGGPDNDSIFGDGGDDILIGHGGDDKIYGGPGAGDSIHGAEGDDKLFGCDGLHDELFGNEGTDIAKADGLDDVAGVETRNSC